MSDPATQSLSAFADRVFPTMGEKSYYQLLNVPPTADVLIIRAAYYKIATQLHPDRFHNVPDTKLRDRLESIYARITEAYRALQNQEKRSRYDQGLTQGLLRLSPKVETRNEGPKNPEDALKNLDAKKFFRLGMLCLGKKDFRGAVLNFTFAKNNEPTAAIIAEKLTEAQAGVKAIVAPPK